VVSYHPGPPQPLRARLRLALHGYSETTSTGSYTTSGDVTFARDRLRDFSLGRDRARIDRRLDQARRVEAFF
jgi:hypothetical protein